MQEFKEKGTQQIVKAIVYQHVVNYFYKKNPHIKFAILKTNFLKRFKPVNEDVKYD